MNTNHHDKGAAGMQDILTFVNGLQDLYEQQSNNFKALIKPPKHVLAKDFERYVIQLWRYLDNVGDATEVEEQLFKFVSDFVVDYDGAYLDFTLDKDML